jgi:hypothetical protein
MNWRQKFVFYLGSGYFFGITLGDWLTLLRENRFAVAPSCLMRAASATITSIPNSVACWLENARYQNMWERVEIPPPLFILGHYRSGTTHLHNLLAVDPRFAYLNAYQGCYPHTFLITEGLNSRIYSRFLPPHRPFDNVPIRFDVPYEDEIAMTTMTHSALYLSFAFPQRCRHYDRFLTYRTATPEEISEWQTALLRLLKKLTFKYNKPLVLKSPPNTCRIKLLLDMFPDAKFVHIHRDPYTVIQSTLHLMRVGLEWLRLQSPDGIDWVDRTLGQWREMYDVYFEERELIPAGNLHEMAFADLERDPVGELKRMYESLRLPPFEAVAPALTEYVASIASYKKNKYEEVPPDLRTRIAESCRRGFEEWGYER